MATSNDHVTFLIYLFGWFSSKSVRPSDLFNCRLLWRLDIKKERKCHWGPLWKHTRKSGSKQHHSSVVATENSTSCVHSPDNESSFAWQEGPHKGFRHNNTITPLLIKFHFSFASNFILISQLLYEQETHCNTSWNKRSFEEK